MRERGSGISGAPAGLSSESIISPRWSEAAAAMVIGGFQRFSLSEFPGRISAVIFCQGCNFRCPYCHNPELVDPARYGAPWPEGRVLQELASRRGRVQGVVLTGGEPTLQEDLESFIRRTRELGFAVKLDTNGSRPEALERLLAAGLLEHVGLDVKAPIDRYADVAHVLVDARTITRSIEALRASGVDHEIRTTWAPALLSLNDLLQMAELIRGCRRWVIQRFVGPRTLDAGLATAGSPSPDELQAARASVEKMGVPCTVR